MAGRLPVEARAPEVLPPKVLPPEVLTVAEMGAAERATFASGIPEERVMEAAGAAVAAVAARMAPPGGSVLVLCGPGKNGGDGFVAARHLAAAGLSVTVASLLEREAYEGVARHHADLWDGEVEELVPELGDAAVDLVVDALFGSGLNRPLEDIAAEVVRCLNARDARVLAVDVPSGVAGDSGEALDGLAPQCAATVTFCRKKPAHLLWPGRALCGRVEVADILVPDRIVAAVGPKLRETGAWLARGLPRRGPVSHKYDFGYVLIRGGETMTGAGRLAARAAQRVGAGLVAVAAPPAALPVYATAAASTILLPAEGQAAWEALLGDERRGVLLVGPGNGATSATRQAAEAALASGRTVLLDADALTVFAGAVERLALLRRGPLVLTPHEGEFRRLFPDLAGDKLTRARAAAARTGAVVVLKGWDSVVAAPDGRAAINASAPPDLAVAGSGDVLSGIVAGLLAQGLPPFEAAALATWLHGRSGEAAGRGLIADDLPDRLPAVLAALESSSLES